MADYLGAVLALLAVLIALVGLLRVVRLLRSIVRSLGTVDALLKVVADATQPVGAHVLELATNVAGIESVSSDMDRFVTAITAAAPDPTTHMSPELAEPPSPTEARSPR